MVLSLGFGKGDWERCIAVWKGPHGFVVGDGGPRSRLFGENSCVAMSQGAKMCPVHRMIQAQRTTTVSSVNGELPSKPDNAACTCLDLIQKLPLGLRHLECCMPLTTSISF